MLMRPRECHHGLVTRWLIRIVGGQAPIRASGRSRGKASGKLSRAQIELGSARASISAPGAASPERGFAIRPSRIATRLAELSQSCPDQVPNHDVRARAANKFSANARSQSPQIKPAPCSASSRTATNPATHLFRPRADRRRPDFRADWNKQQDDCEAAETGDPDPDECRVAIDLMTLHKEGTAQQSIIQYARLWGAFGTARLPMLGSSSTLFVLHQHSLC